MPNNYPENSPPNARKYTSAEERHKEALREQSPALQALYQRDQDIIKATKEMPLEEVATTLGTTIKFDVTSKTLQFYGTILNYTEEEQQNFSSTAPSSVGKTFVTKEVLDYFPEEDIICLGYTSPTAFFHLNSKLCTENGDPLANRDRYVEEGLKEWEELNQYPAPRHGREKWKESRNSEKRRLKAEWDEIDKYYVVDLEQKILYFQDQPHDKLLQNLRPVLSHDNKKTVCNITDKTKEGGNRTKKIIILGYPTVHFTSVRSNNDDQERTRLWLTSPEISQDKFLATLLQQSEALTNRDAFKNKLKLDESRRLLKLRVRLIKESMVRNVIIRSEDAEAIYTEFISTHQPLKPRHQRDFPRLIALIKAHALFNQWTREKTVDGTTVYAEATDIREGPKLCEKLLESNEKGLPPHVFRFWEESLQNVLDDKPEGLHKNDVSQLYFQFYHTRIGSKALTNMINLLLDTGFILEDTDPNDKRRKKLYCPDHGVEKKGNKATSLQHHIAEFSLFIGNNEKRLDEIVDEFGLSLNDTQDILNVMSKNGIVFQTLASTWRLV